MALCRIKIAQPSYTFRAAEALSGKTLFIFRQSGRSAEVMEDCKMKGRCSYWFHVMLEWVEIIPEGFQEVLLHIVLHHIL